MKKFFSIAIAVASLMASVINCSAPSQQGSKAAPDFKFRQDGTFKIVQITDTHLSTWNSEEETAYVIGRLGDVIDAEKPDLIAFTGDNVTSCSTKELWDKMLAMIDTKGIPFACVYGNHDREEQLSDIDLPQCFVNDPLCINTLTEDGYLDDMAVTVASASGDKTAAVLYFMDSGDYSPVAYHLDYGWITHDQMHWYMEQSRAFARANANVPVPSYAFFHIPTAEFYEAYNTDLICGVRNEKECPAELNGGVFSAFEVNGDVHGVFVGHDHENDYVARLGSIAAVYGRCCYYKRDDAVPGNGTRVIELREGDYGFRTWVREPAGVVDDVHFDVDLDFKLRPATEVSGLQPGLVRTMYSDVKEMMEMETTAVKGEVSVVPTPRMIDRMGTGCYGAIQEGYIYVPETGAWSIHASESSQGLVCIDDVTINPNYWSRGQIKVNLEKGYHPIKIYMKASCNGGCWCKLMWRDQFDERYNEIPADYFFHK